MPLERRPAATMQAQSVNLYCAHCEAQIGIFENEWIRLTSSYARAKEPGTQFGTQIGERLQVVPSGAVQKSAVGCQMAEVFCRKCSNMVGQYCKSAPSAAQQEFVNQLFYKLSRTFLKDSKTNAKVDAVFAFDTTQERPTVLNRQTSNPTRWQNTPLRESSSTPVTLQPSVHEPNDLRGSSVSRNEPNRRQSSRVVDREGRIFELEGRLRFHDGRLMDQENFLNDISARLHEHENVIDEQRASFQSQDIDLHDMRDQITTLQQSIDDLRSTLLLNKVDNIDQRATSPGSMNWAGQLDVLVQALRSARDTAKEVQSLKEENQQLKSQLTSFTSNGPGQLDPTSTGMGQIAHFLGKRKRDGQNPESMLTPQSNRSAQQSPNQPSGNSNIAPVVSINERDAQTGMDATVPSEKFGNNAMHGKVTKSGKLSKASKAQSKSKPSNSTRDSLPETNSSAKEAANEHLPATESYIPEGENTHDLEAPLDPMDLTYDDESLLYVDDDVAVNQAPQMEFVQDPTAFDDLGFSDEEDDDPDNETFNAGQDDIEIDESTEITADVPVLRDGRSTAPEPFLKPKPPANRTRTYITLDRVHIATPWTFWCAYANGQQPKLIKPPAIQTRKKDLEEELIALGLQQWIGKDKKSREYREAVDAARTRIRNEKRAALLASKGLKPVTVPIDPALVETDSPAVLSSIQNVRAGTSFMADDLDIESGNENSQSTSMVQRKESEAAAIDGQEDYAPTSRSTRRRTPCASNDLQTATNETDAAYAMDLNADEEQQPKRKRKPTERAKAQRKSDLGTPQVQPEVHKRPRGRPRKSAPAELPVTSVELQEEDLNATTALNASNDRPTADVGFSHAADAASPTLPANKQQLLEKMRLKAQQKEQLREEMIKDRDRLAEEAMAAMEREEMAT